MRTERERQMTQLPMKVSSLEKRLNEAGNAKAAKSLRLDYETLQVDYLLAMQDVLSSYEEKLR